MNYLIKNKLNYVRQYGFVEKHGVDKVRVDNFASYQVDSCGEFTSTSLLNFPA